MRLTWLTDIHLNFLEFHSRKQFYQDITEKNGDAILITGDIAEASSISELLEEMAYQVKKPIYFVLGNHDYYRGQIDDVKKIIISLTKKEALLNWLPASGSKIFKEDTILLGQDGWADGRYGDYANSRISLNDSRLIVDLFQQKILGKYPLLEKMQELADIDAKQLHNDFEQVVGRYHPKKIIVLTHVPPFKEACFYEGRNTDDDWLPYFSSKAMGDVLMKMAKENTNIQFLVLCGHTHSKANYQALDNLVVKVGGAEYSHPEVQEVITI